MIVLKYNQILLTWIGISSNRLNEPTNEFLKTINCYVMLFGLTGSMIVCGAFAMYNSQDNIPEMLQAFYIVSAGIQCVGSYVSIGINMKMVKSLQNDLQRITDNGNNLQKSTFTNF